MKDSTLETMQTPQSKRSPYQAEAPESRVKAPLSGPSLLQMQRLYGNRYVQRMLAQRQPEEDDEIQTKAIQRQAEEEDESLQAKAIQRQPEEDDEIQARFIQRVGMEGGLIHPQVQADIQRARSGGQPLDGTVQKQMSASLGHDFSGVRVHADADADRLNQQLSARAFTTGNDIFFQQGAYSPASGQGRELIAHELSHVIQQSTGRVSGGGGGMTVRPAGDAFEQEADALSHKAATDSVSADSHPVSAIQAMPASREIQRDACLIPRNRWSPYAHLPSVGAVGPDENFDPNQRFAILKENFQRLGNGKAILANTQVDIQQSDYSNNLLFDPRDLKAYIAEVDHIVPRKKGGGNTQYNAQVLEGTENASKGDTYPWGSYSGYEIYDPGTQQVYSTRRAAKAGGADLTALKRNFSYYLDKVPKG